MLGELTAKFWTAAQTSGYMCAKEQQGGCGVSGQLFGWGHGIGEFSSTFPSWLSRVRLALPGALSNSHHAPSQSSRC